MKSSAERRAAYWRQNHKAGAQGATQQIGTYKLTAKQARRVRRKEKRLLRGDR